MKRNRYFKGMMPNAEQSKIYKIIVSGEGGVVPCKTGNKSIIKLHLGDEEEHACLNSFEGITHAQAVIEVNGEPDI